MALQLVSNFTQIYVKMWLLLALLAVCYGSSSQNNDNNNIIEVGLFEAEAAAEESGPRTRKRFTRSFDGLVDYVDYPDHSQSNLSKQTVVHSI